MGKHYNIENYIGKEFKYGLIVKGLDHEYLKKHPTANRWIFECTCKKTFSSAPGHVACGQKRSCGCKIEQSKKKPIHGLSYNRFYHVWVAIKQRCYNEQDKHYPRYGGRGIKMCDEWKCGPRAFIEWAEKTCPNKKGYSIDRKNNFGPYSPDNCAWATTKEQARNTRANKILHLNGEEKCIAEWAEIYGLHPTTISQRLKSGWSIERALTEPVHTNCRHKG